MIMTPTNHPEKQLPTTDEWRSLVNQILNVTLDWKLNHGEALDEEEQAAMDAANALFKRVEEAEVAK